MRTERQKRHIAAFGQDAPLADREDFARFGHGRPRALAARVTQRDRSAVMRGGGGHHMHQFRLIGAGHHHHVGQGGHEPDIERPGMGRAVGADQSRAVDHEAHRQVLQRHVMDHLVIAALKKAGIDRAKGPQPACRKPGTERHGMLFGDPHVEDPRRQRLLQRRQAGTARHGRGNADDTGVLFGQLQQFVSENARVIRGIGGGFLLLAGRDIEFRNAMVAAIGPFGRCIALALDRDGMDQDRPGGARLGCAQNRQKLAHVMSVDRADIGEAQMFEQGRGFGMASDQFARTLCALTQGFGQVGRDPIRDVLQRGQRRLTGKTGQIARHRPGGRCDRHVVVVQDDEQPAAKIACIVERLIGHARADRPVADNGDRIACCLAQFARHREAERGGNAGRGMGCAERVVIAFGPLGETAQPVLLAQGPNAGAATGKDLMGVTLVTHVPDELVIGGVEYRVDRHAQFDDTKRGSKMAARLRHGRDRFGAQFVGATGQFGVAQPSQVGGPGHPVQHRGVGIVGISGWSCHSGVLPNPHHLRGSGHERGLWSLGRDERSALGALNLLRARRTRAARSIFRSRS